METGLSVALPQLPHVLTDEFEKKEKCGLFGIWGTADAAQLCFQGIFAQQHRGQESAGIAITDGNELHGHAGAGLVTVALFFLYPLGWSLVSRSRTGKEPGRPPTSPRSGSSTAPTSCSPSPRSGSRR